MMQADDRLYADVRIELADAIAAGAMGAGGSGISSWLSGVKSDHDYLH